MRPIKFRAWVLDEVDNAFHMWYSEEETLSDFFGWYLPERDGNKDILMQFTGLQDKNGKDIYEGDVVKVYDKRKKNIHYEAIDVIYNERFASWELRATGNTLEYYIVNSFDNVFEVIGNIHENPELLK